MYKIEFTKAARKVYKNFSKDIQQIIDEKLSKLAESPYSPQHDVKKLQDMDNCYRLRVRDWRIIYQIDNDVLIIEIVRIAHRKEVYK